MEDKEESWPNSVGIVPDKLLFQRHLKEWKKKRVEKEKEKKEWFVRNRSGNHQGGGFSGNYDEREKQKDDWKNKRKNQNVDWKKKMKKKPDEDVEQTAEEEADNGWRGNKNNFQGTHGRTNFSSHSALYAITVLAAPQKL